MTVPSRIFLSYRHGDCDAVVDALERAIAELLGPKNVVRDKSWFERGKSWRRQTTSLIGETAAIVAVFGPRWDKGGRRGDDDPIIYELREAARLRIDVILVLADGAGVPNVSRFPRDVRPMLESIAFPVRSDAPESVSPAAKRAIEAVRRTRETLEGAPTLRERYLGSIGQLMCGGFGATVILLYLLEGVALLLNPINVISPTGPRYVLYHWFGTYDGPSKFWYDLLCWSQDQKRLIGYFFIGVWYVVFARLTARSGEFNRGDLGTRIALRALGAPMWSRRASVSWGVATAAAVVALGVPLAGVALRFGPDADDTTLLRFVTGDPLTYDVLFIAYRLFYVSILFVTLTHFALTVGGLVRLRSGSSGVFDRSDLVSAASVLVVSLLFAICYLTVASRVIDLTLADRTQGLLLALAIVAVVIIFLLRHEAPGPGVISVSRERWIQMSIPAMLFSLPLFTGALFSSVSPKYDPLIDMANIRAYAECLYRHSRHGADRRRTKFVLALDEAARRSIWRETSREVSLADIEGAITSPSAGGGQDPEQRESKACDALAARSGWPERGLGADRARGTSSVPTQGATN